MHHKELVCKKLSFYPPGSKETGLSNTDRLAYLRSALKTKDGQDIMDAKTGSGDDYDELVANLKQRYLNSSVGGESDRGFTCPRSTQH